MEQNCPRCGSFKISGSVLSVLRKKDKLKLSSWIRNENEIGATPEITSENLQSIIRTQIPSVEVRAETLLRFMYRNVPTLGAPVPYYSASIAAQALTWAINQEETRFIEHYLTKKGYLEKLNLNSQVITPEGHIFLEGMESKNAASSNAFVAMSFAPEYKELFERGISVGISKAGYRPVRVDNVEHNGKIDDEIIAQIRKSRFVVADFTGHRAGVYYEAGFAQGLRLPVVWSCRLDDVANLHFDIRQYNCLTWASPEEIVLPLQNRIEALLGRGPI